MERTPTPSLPGQALATSGRSFHSHDVNTSPALSSIITLSDPRPFERQSPRLAHQPLPALVGQATDVLLQRQLLGLEARYGEGSEATLSTLKELCLVLTIRARYASAETIARKRLAACRSLYGDLHINTGTCLIELGVMFHLQGYHHDTLKVLQRAASILEASVGPRSRDYLELQLYSGITYLCLDLPLAAIDVLRHNGEIAFQVLGEADPVTLSFQTCLLPALLVVGQSLEAENKARALKLLLHKVPYTLVLRSVVMAIDYWLGCILLRTFRLTEAGDILESCWREEVKSRGPEHPYALRVSYSLARTLMECDRLADALAQIDSCIGPATRVLGPNHPKTQTYRRLREEIIARKRLANGE